MEFIDNTGHIFSLKSFDDNYINLDFKEQDYIFWLKDYSVSVNNYYIKPIRFLIEYDLIEKSLDTFDLEITNNSKFYKLIGPKYLQNKLENISNLSESITLDKNNFKDKLVLNDFYFDKETFELEENTENLIVYNNDSKFILFPFYVIGRSEIEGTFINNITIKYTYNTDKIITITKTFTRDEYYDYLIKNSFSDIEIYSCDKYGNNEQLVATLKSGYNNDIIESGCNEGLNRYEILYNKDLNEEKIPENVVSSLYDINDEEHQTNQYNRIRNFFIDDFNNSLIQLLFDYCDKNDIDILTLDLYDKNFWEIDFQNYLNTNVNTVNNIINKKGYLPYDVYHYIYRLDEELPEGYYKFKGKINDGCDYCGSVIGLNHDGYGALTRTYNISLSGNNAKVTFLYKFNSLYNDDNDNEFNLQRLSEINPQYIYNEETHKSEWSYANNNDNVPGYEIKQDPIYLTKFRDIWFDIDNKAISENTDGATIEIIENETKYNYTPISVGCTFIDECEELIINGKNMGIRLPKEILKAVYNSSYYSKYADEKLLKNKLKELLLNYMNIKGQCGNVKSMLNSLKWFGWNNYVEINRLLKTDNEFKNQFILDYFDIESNIKDTFKYFNQTNNITLSVLDNIETGNNYTQNFNNLFHGEGKPILENLFDKNIEIIKENISYYKPYYNFIFNELALKLDCLKYYYQQYFLPIHINILRASVTHKVYANTMKMNLYANTTLIDSPLYLLNNCDNINVIFPDTHILLFQNGKYLIDSKYNVFSNYKEDYESEDLYYVNENCISIPISLINNNNQFSEDEYGEYIKNDNGEYFKINYFYEVKYSVTTDSKITKKSDRFTATHYSLKENIETKEDLISLENIIRYNKVSEGYFNCKLYLTYMTIEQNNLGHYVYIDNKYIYKDKFYKYDMNYFNIHNDENNEDSHIENYIDDSYNYILYYNNYIRIDPKNRYDIKTIYLINDNNFNYYQNSEQYYTNFIIIPRILNNNIDWLKGYYRLSLCVNNKWFYYDFTIKLPNVYINLGKLQYKYLIEDNDENIYYPFKQLRSLNPLKFNSFMFNPDLISVNTLFKENDENNNYKLLTFFDKLLQVRNNIDYTMNMFYKEYYKDKIIIPYNEKYFNRIHLFDIYDENNEKLIWNENDIYEILYSKFFNDDCSCKLEVNENILYDYYLMHDDKEWYMVLISQYPIASYIDKSLLNIHNDIYHIENYTIKYANYSIDKFLINRMDIINANGFNHFNMDDLIISYVDNNDYQFNIDLTNKWSINKIYDVNKIFEMNSNSNIAIIANNNKNNLYTPGYYNIQLNYTINGLDNISNTIIGEFKVENEYQQIEYPIINEITDNQENKIYNIDFTISDFSILYENSSGNRKSTPTILNPNSDYHPIGIKVINKGYFGDEQKWSVYIGLKLLNTKDPDNGYSGLENPSIQFGNPYYGFINQNINTETLTLKDKAAYLDTEHLIPVGPTGTSNENVSNKIFYTQTDNQTTTNSINGEFKWPVGHNRGWPRNPINSNDTIYLNILNDDDTLNTDLFDDTCAIFDFNGYENTQKIIEEFDNLEEDWRKSNTISNLENRFSPIAACAWRYHTIGTNQGDWYIPAYGEIMCMSLNYKRLSDLFENIAEQYPNDCNPTLFSDLGSNAVWSSTQYNNIYTWEIHPIQARGHAYFKDTTLWKTIPYIRINDETLKVYYDTYNINYIYDNDIIFKNYIYKYEDSHNKVLENFSNMTYDELISFNEFNIAPYLADHIGIYSKNNNKIGILNLWNSISKSFNERKYRIGLMSDIHYNDNTIDSDNETYSVDNVNSEYHEDLINTLSFYQNKEDIKFMCVSGDISTDSIKHIMNFKQALNIYAPTTNLYSCLGNHDFKTISNTNIIDNDYNEIGLEVEEKTRLEAWNSLIIPPNSEYEIHYENEINEYKRTSFWFEVPIKGTNKSDIYIFLSLNYDNNDTKATKKLYSDSPNIQPLIDYVGYMPSRYNFQFYDNLTLIWLKNLLDQFQNKRIFIFTHQFFVHKAGSNNAENNLYSYGGDSWRINDNDAYCLSGIQFEFLNKLNNEYKKTIWFTGHSHYKWNWQINDPYINICNNEYEIFRPDDEDFNESKRYLRRSQEPIKKTGYNIHLPSTCRPLPLGINRYEVAGGDSEGAIMDVYEKYIDIRGIIFKENGNNYENKYCPLAQYRINIPAS